MEAKDTIVDAEEWCDVFEKGRKAGMREVVEWIEWDLSFDSFGGSRLDKSLMEWQAQLEEWGIDEEASKV